MQHLQISGNQTSNDKLYVQVTVHLWLVNKCETNYMQQLVILLLINFPQHVSGIFTPILRRSDCVFAENGYLSCKRKSVWSIVLWRVDFSVHPQRKETNFRTDPLREQPSYTAGHWPIPQTPNLTNQSSNLLRTMHTACQPTLQHHNRYVQS